MTARIRKVNLDQFAECLPRLADLLVDAVESGGSLGFWAPLPQSEALLYWREVMQGMVEENLLLLVAEDGREVVGSVQLLLSDRQNGRHRAEIRKLMVHTSRRGWGWGARSCPPPTSRRAFSAASSSSSTRAPATPARISTSPWATPARPRFPATRSSATGRSTAPPSSTTCCRDRESPADRRR
ncbi:MAG: GNAT family N-acetyltransferase [Betaproteobacteria bacterium]|nr:GNAT family N-acetyltransferase [Betaproteobacteria bacterium]